MQLVREAIAVIVRFPRTCNRRASLRRITVARTMITAFLHSEKQPPTHVHRSLSKAPTLHRSKASSTVVSVKLALAFFVALVSAITLPARADDDPFAVNARLLASVRNEDGAGVTRALRDGAAVNSRNRLGESGLLIALKKNRADLARLLLDAGADVNEAAVNGITPLMAAAYAGDVEMTRALLERGADPAPVDRIGKNAITYAAGEGHTEIVRMLLGKGIDPNAVYRNDLTALMWAAGYGHADTARALIEAGARIDAVDNRGKSALDIAREFKHAATVDVLEKARRDGRR